MIQFLLPVLTFGLVVISAAAAQEDNTKDLLKTIPPAKPWKYLEQDPFKPYEFSPEMLGIPSSYIKYPGHDLPSQNSSRDSYLQSYFPENEFLEREVPVKQRLLHPRSMQDIYSIYRDNFTVTIDGGKRAKPCQSGPIVVDWNVLMTNDPIERQEFFMLSRVALKHTFHFLSKHGSKFAGNELLPSSITSADFISTLRRAYVGYRKCLAYDQAPPHSDLFVENNMLKSTRHKCRRDLPTFKAALRELLGEEGLNQLDDWLKKNNRYLLIPCDSVLTVPTMAPQNSVP